MSFTYLFYIVIFNRRCITRRWGFYFPQIRYLWLFKEEDIYILKVVRILEKLGIRVAKEPSKETVRDLLEQYSLKPNQENAMKLGRAIANDSAPLEVKKWRFRMALDVVTPDMAVYSTIQAWSSITMLEDNLPASMKITSVKEMLKNPNLENEVLDEILLTI